MRKLLQMGALALGLLMAQYGFAADNSMQSQAPVQNQQGVIYDGGQGQCPPDQCCDQKLNDCYCLYCHYEPCYYTTRRCVEEQVPCKRRCCRMVPQYYEVQRCRMVPQYYNETCCRQVPEYYDVCETKCCQKWVCDQHCRYVPRYYWKHICGNSNCNAPYPTAPACPINQ